MVGHNSTFEGKLIRFGIKKHFDKADQITMLFSDVYINGIYVDHMWIIDCKRLRKHNLHINSIIQFNCVVESYYKGEVDYSVKQKRIIKILEKGNGENLLNFASQKRIIDEVMPIYKELIQKENEKVLVSIN
jgi:hypothetical protein